MQLGILDTTVLYTMIMVYLYFNTVLSIIAKYIRPPRDLDSSTKLIVNKKVSVSWPQNSLDAIIFPSMAYCSLNRCHC